MSFRDVKLILDSRLNVISGDLPVAWENTIYVPEVGIPWIRPTLINGPSNDIDLNSHQLNPGIYRVDVFYPLGVGERDLFDKLDEIYNHFKSVSVLSSGDTIVNIQAVSVLPRLVDDAWVMGSLDINFVNYDDNIVTSFPTPNNNGGWINAPLSLTVNPGSRYISTSDTDRVIFTLPPTCVPGDYFRIAGFGDAGWGITQNSGQNIIYGDQETSVGVLGGLSSTNPHDAIELVCVVANTKWEVLTSQGNIVVS